MTLCALSPDFNPFEFLLWGGKMSRVYHGGKREGRLHLVEATNKAAICFSGEMRRMMCQYSMTQRLAACKKCDDGHFERLL